MSDTSDDEDVLFYWDDLPPELRIELKANVQQLADAVERAKRAWERRWGLTWVEDEDWIDDKSMDD